MKIRTLSILFVILALILAACAGTASNSSNAGLADTGSKGTQEVMMENEPAGENSGDAMMDESSGDAMQTSPGDGAMTDSSTPMSDDEMMEDSPGDTMNDSEMMGDHNADPTNDGEMMNGDSADSMTGEDMDTEGEMMAGPAWLQAPLTDVNTGETFMIAGFQGKVVLVETLAMWCSNCLQQQKQVLALHTLLGERDDFVSLGLDIDPNENAGDLQGYTERNGFHWLYAIAPPEVAREIGNEYGQQFLNPPSTPMLIIDRQGQAHPLPFGIKSTEDLQKALQPFLDEAM